MSRKPVRIEGPAFSPFDWWAASARAGEQAMAAQKALVEAQKRGIAATDAMLDAARQAVAFQQQGVDMMTRAAEMQRQWLRLWGL